ncbi:AmmeMemoRadiSam system protein B [Gracilimonas sp. BCB1]|uniref:AmmeMemoRadiSam system protein B n=1 Tax=Gracilimonas sp. BCB1 TaxID=3152362 RepID=UPI0032D96526
MRNKLFNSFTDPIPPLRYDVQIIPVKQNGETFLYFQDQLGYAHSDFAVPYSAQSLFSLFDGSRSVEDILEFSDEQITKEQILEYVQFLDEKALLHSPYFKEHAQQTEAEYEQSDVHSSNTYGISYPEDPEELEHFLNEAFEKLPSTEAVESAKALYAPHIDYRVGLNSYVKAFSAIKNLTPKRVVILATSHYSGLYPELYEEHPFVISNKDFELVNGTVEADREAIQEIADQVRDDELDYGITFKDRAHRIEHSIELHLLLLNHLWDHEFKIVPIVVGSLEELFYKADGFQGQQVEQFSQLMNKLFGKDEDTFFCISGDLAHVGKKFGDEQPAKELFEDIRAFDEDFLDFGAEGNPDKILELMSQEYDPYRICGYPPLFSFLKAFPTLQGEILTYDIWDEEERESGVSFGSILYF